MKTPIKCGECPEIRHAWGRFGPGAGYCLYLRMPVATKEVPCRLVRLPDLDLARRLWAKRMGEEEVNIFSLGD